MFFNHNNNSFRPHQIQQLQQLQQKMVSGLTSEISHSLLLQSNDSEQTHALPSLNLHDGIQQDASNMQSQLIQEYSDSFQTLQGIVLPQSKQHFVRISLAPSLQDMQE